MNVRFKLCLVLSLGFIAACTPHTPPRQTRWNGEGSRPAISFDALATQNETRVHSASEEVQIVQQRFSKFPVVGTFIKTIRPQNKAEVIFESSVLIERVPLSILTWAEYMDRDKEKSWNLFLRKNSSFKDFKVITPLQVVLTLHDEKAKPTLRATVENKAGEIFEVDLKKNGQLIAQTPQGSHLNEPTEVSALAFPLGPKRSELTPVSLSRIVTPEGLANSWLQVFSESLQKITAANVTLEYSPPDERFDQVQAFYFAQQILNWFEKKVQLRLPNPLRIVTHVGYPDKTNAAFYYQGLVRLGAGDEITFANIPWDPSVVMHETSHAMIDTLTRLPFQGEGGSINEGYADLFTTFFRESPLLGDSSYRPAEYKRSVDTVLKRSELNGGLYHDSALISGFFWELRKTLGADQSLDLAVRVLNRLGPNSDFNDFILNLNEQSRAHFKEVELEKINNLMKERELL